MEYLSTGSDFFICALMITLITLETSDDSHLCGQVIILISGQWILVKTLISCTGYKEKNYTDFRIVEQRTTGQTNKEQPNGVNKKD